MNIKPNTAFSKRGQLSLQIASTNNRGHSAGWPQLDVLRIALPTVDNLRNFFLQQIEVFSFCQQLREAL